MNHLHITFTTLRFHHTLLIITAPQAEGDAEECSPFAWAGALSGVSEEVSRGGRCCIAEELDTSKLIVGERSERSANLVRGEMEGTAKVFDAIDDMGTDGGRGMRCCSSTPTIHLSPEAQIVKEKKTYPTDPNSSPSESQVPPS